MRAKLAYQNVTMFGSSVQRSSHLLGLFCSFNFNLDFDLVCYQAARSFQLDYVDSIWVFNGVCTYIVEFSLVLSISSLKPLKRQLSRHLNNHIF